MHDMYLIVIEKAAGNYSAYVPDVPGVAATGKSVEETRDHMAEALAVQLNGMREDGDALPVPVLKSADEVEDLAPGDAVAFVQPAPMNPVSLEVERVLREARLTQSELARRLGTSRAAVSRLADPFYWGHSLATLRRLAEVLGLEVEVRLKPGRDRLVPGNPHKSRGQSADFVGVNEAAHTRSTSPHPALRPSGCFALRKGRGRKAKHRLCGCPA